MKARAAILLVAALVGWGSAAEAGRMRMVVADLPYARVWDAAVRAVADYPLESAAAGRIVTGWRERPPRASEPGFTRVTERVVMEVVETGVRITRISVDVEARGWRDGESVALPDTEATEREVLAHVRAAQP